MCLKMPLIWKPYSLIASAKTPQRTDVYFNKYNSTNLLGRQILAKQFLLTPPWEDKSLTGKQISYDNLYTSRGVDILRESGYRVLGT